ncbi:phosphate ABC transporter substrate-binding protein [Shewanella algae]|uniref:phosphate ABC transporter substrate-binding protein n=1 Tax=Shewanella algae TaxID=38313 RepID=UPI0004717170|nr:phosphate ABC transporter substrate-binding protein [Shewanella algae]MBO2640666.1 phosphate ABC transporter substrate-binding protein [Shewanella algae]PST66681.1 phosphate-binding protein [Shewanella algae]
MRLKFRFIKLLLCSVLAVPAVGMASELDRFENLSGTLNIAGGTAHIPVMKQAAKTIMSANNDIRITIAGGGSGVGAQQVAKGLVEIGNTGRPLKPGELKYGLLSFPFAIDGVAVIVNPANPIQQLSSQQVIDIYSGKITNWKSLGGEDRQINIFTRDEASGTRSVFVKKLLNKSPVSAQANVVPSNGAMKTAIARDPGAIGYSSVGYIDQTVKAPILDNVLPTNEACASGEYPVVRKLYMNTKGQPKGLTQAFIDYIYGPDGAEFIREAGYIPVGH